MKLFGAVLIVLLVISLVFASGCAQKTEKNETERAYNETKKVENKSENLTKEAEGVPQEVTNVVEKSDRNVMQVLADRNFVTLVELINSAGLEKVSGRRTDFILFLLRLMKPLPNFLKMQFLHLKIIPRSSQKS